MKIDFHMKITEDTTLLTQIDMKSPYCFRKKNEKTTFRRILQECLFAVETIKIEEIDRKDILLEKANETLDKKTKEAETQNQRLRLMGQGSDKSY